ncbi:hypothetical protein DL96DRAFT_1668873 [Flagelloscypha sp. PMI_526]|nr:hypothetical protein DL96DRAFT_1668873 [Flagelloscypha sp. PMI_526]
MGNSPSAPSALETCVRGVLSKGAISVPSDPFYDLNAVKRYNTAYDITPVAVVRPSTTDEVSKVVKCATDNGVKLAARSGGHSYADYSIGGADGSLVIDMVNFQQFSMDSATGHATIGSGTLLGDVTDRLHKAGGRAMAHGTCPQVGIGGHATIGGLGPISRLWGSALDHVIEAEVVLANGTVVRTNEQNHPEVLWALKGAAASFGVITEFKVITHEEPKEVTRYSYKVQFGSHEKMADTFAGWQQFISKPDLSRKFASQVIAFEFGMIIQGNLGQYFGPKAEFDALGFDQVMKNATGSVSMDGWLGSVANWAENEAIALVGGASGPFYSKSLTFTDKTLIPLLIPSNLFSNFSILRIRAHQSGGATNDVPTDATAYAHRDTLFYIQTYAFGIGSLPDASRKYINDINALIEAGMPGVDFGAYAGYVDPYLENGQQKYWGSNYPRLQQLKGQLDPKNIFVNPQSVQAA